jgi:hypothetical protein
MGYLGEQTTKDATTRVPIGKRIIGVVTAREGCESEVVNKLRRTQWCHHRLAASDTTSVVCSLS